MIFFLAAYSTVLLKMTSSKMNYDMNLHYIFFNIIKLKILCNLK